MPNTVRPSSSEFPQFSLVRYPLQPLTPTLRDGSTTLGILVPPFFGGLSAVFDGFPDRPASKIARKFRGSAVFTARGTVHKP
jgi:hypothetical protein